LTRDFSKAHIVNSVSEEYVILHNTPCECGGQFQMLQQSLIEHAGKMYDILHCICAKCKKEMDLLFDINSFFGKEFEF